MPAGGTPWGKEPATGRDVDLVTERDPWVDLPAEQDPAPMPDLDLELDPESGGGSAGPDRASAGHQMLLRLAGRMPDGLLTRSRDWLARGRLGDLARSVAFWAVSQDVVLTETDAMLLSSLLTEADADPSGLTQLTLEDFDPFPYYAFAPEIPPDLRGGSEETPDTGAPDEAPVDQAAVQAVAVEEGAIGLWRAWRFPADGAPWPPPRRVFVVEIGDTDAPRLAARMQDRLAAEGEADPQVEVYQSGSRLPIYQDFARIYGTLLWAAGPDPGIQIAAIFDEVDADTGPVFSPDHPLLADDEAARVVEYLLSGEPLLVTDGLMDDVLDTMQLYCVPMSFRTDGKWVWNEASAYYAEQYQLGPDTGLLAHVRANDYTPPAVDGVALHRALQVLEDSPGEEASWMFASEFDESESESAPGMNLDPEPENAAWSARGHDSRVTVVDVIDQL
jgi:hypothetical protein